MLQRQVSAVLLCRYAVRIVLRLWTSLGHTAPIPAFLRARGGAPDSVPRQSATVSSCTAVSCTYSATVQKPEMPQRSSWSGCSRARCYAATVAWGWTVPKTVEVPQLQLVQFLEVIDTPVVLATTGACVGPDIAENREVSARVLELGSLPVVVQRHVPDCRDSAENCGFSAVGAAWTRLLTCPCWPRHGAVEVPQLQFIDWCVSSSWL